MILRGGKFDGEPKDGLGLRLTGNRLELSVLLRARVRLRLTVPFDTLHVL